MNRKTKDTLIALGSIAVLGAEGIIEVHSQGVVEERLENKIHPDLEELIKSGTYPRYMTTDKVDLLIKYKDFPSDKDLAAIRSKDINGLRGEIINQEKTVRAGFPADIEKIRSYASRPNVIGIAPNMKKYHY